LSGGYSQTDNPMLAFGSILNQGGFDDTIDFNDPGRTDNLGFQAEVNYRFYNGGRDQAAGQAAEALQLASETDRTAIEHRLGFEVVRAYQAIIQAGDQVAAREAELSAIDSSLQVAGARYEAGVLLRADLLQFEVQQARASEQLIIARHQLDLAQRGFLNLLGLSGTDAMLQPGSADEQALPPADHYRERPEIKALSARMKAVEAALTGARGALQPTLDGFANYRYDRGWEVDGEGSSWLAGLQLTYQLYDGGHREAEIARKSAELAEIKAQLAKLRLAVDLEIQEAELNQRQAAERRLVTDKMVQVARESAQLNRERFQQGVILASDLIDSEVRLTEALVRQSAARANCRTATALLRQAAGMQQFAPTTEELLETQP
ncbi:MAG: TolC family protein, partial [Desulfofustis sp.]|nr:TolC family protein [Desulfofustis sp.]